MDHILHPVMPALILLGQFAAFAHCVVYCFISRFALLTVLILLGLICLSFYHFPTCKFSPPVLTGGISLESEGQPIPTVLFYFSEYSSLHFTSKPLGTVVSRSTAIGITINFMLHSFFNSLARFKYLSFCFLWFSLCFAGKAKSTRYFFIVNQQYVIPPDQRWTIRLYLTIPNCVISKFKNLLTEHLSLPIICD